MLLSHFLHIDKLNQNLYFFHISLSSLIIRHFCLIYVSLRQIVSILNHIKFINYLCYYFKIIIFYPSIHLIIFLLVFKEKNN